SGNAVAAMPDGAAVVVGTFNGSVLLASTSGPGISLTATDQGAFFARYSATGAALWARAASANTSGGGVTANGVAALADGSAFAVGRYDAVDTTFGAGGADAL